VIDRPDAVIARVDAELAAFLDECATTLSRLGTDLAPVSDAARRFVLDGGKRLRPTFAYWGWRTVHDADEDDSDLISAAASLELLHACALVHDDVMDASATRRGRPAAHAAFADIHRAEGWAGDPDVFGTSAAILLGDLLLSWSDGMLRTCGLPRVAVDAALDFFDTTRSEVITGQFLDVSAQARGESDLGQAMRVLRYKSAKYSIERPLHVGASLAGAEPPLLEELGSFGLPLGEAFQLRDDLLGVFGDPNVTGKPAGDDLTEGKRTVLVALAVERAAPADASRLDAALGSSLNLDEVEELRRIIEESGAHAEVEKRIGELTETSLAALDDAPITEVAREALRELAAAVTQRAI
jgi:geranylgeranyl diphosphate synthase, type I